MISCSIIYIYIYIYIYIACWWCPCGLTWDSVPKQSLYWNCGEPSLIYTASAALSQGCSHNHVLSSFPPETECIPGCCGLGLQVRLTGTGTLRIQMDIVDLETVRDGPARPANSCCPCRPPAGSWRRRLGHIELEDSRPPPPLDSRLARWPNSQANFKSTGWSRTPNVPARQNSLSDSRARASGPFANQIF